MQTPCCNHCWYSTRNSSWKIEWDPIWGYFAPISQHCRSYSARGGYFEIKMKSPLTSLPMRLTSALRSIPFKNSVFQIDYKFYLCETTGERFVTTALDELNFQSLEKDALLDKEWKTQYFNWVIVIHCLVAIPLTALQVLKQPIRFLHKLIVHILNLFT